MRKFFTEAFAGTLVSDFCGAYDSVAAEDRQYCLVHLLREIEKVDERNNDAEWRAFAKQLRRLVRDGIRLRKRADFAPPKYPGRIRLINRRLCALAADSSALPPQERRLADLCVTTSRVWRPVAPGRGRSQIL